MSAAAKAWLSAAATVALVAYLFFPSLICPTRCTVDPVAVQGPGLGHIELPDLDLNAWILAWVQRALLEDPGGLFDANIFYPAPDTLTQSEHMLAVAFWTLPLRLVSSSAVWLHQAALIGSSLILALTTAALVRWLSGSVMSGFAAGFAALWMPWRFTELAHVQLMNAQWIPLVWLYAGRIVVDPSRRGAVLGLALALLLQVLSSFYLSYFLLLSCAGLLAGLALACRPERAAWRRLALAAAPAAAALVAVGIPYLRWGREQGFRAVDPLFDSLSPADLLSYTLPSLPTGLRLLPLATSFAVPLAVALLALTSFATLWDRRRTARVRVTRGFVIGLSLACLGAWVLALGRRLELDGTSLPLPGSLAAALVPGFENLRNPLRFAIVIGVAAPVLAGLGFARLRSLPRTPRARSVLGFSMLLLLALDLVTPPLPARDAWEGNRARAAYRVLASLPRGPLVEIPWPLQTEHDALYAGRYMLGSTLHWQPLLNGHSGYHPRSYPLLRQVAQGLPSAVGLARLRQLVDVRWVLVHEGDLLPDARRAWRRAVAEGRFRSVFADADTRLLEVADWRPGAPYLAQLADPAPRERTLAGLSRAPLSAAEGSGRLVLEAPEAFHFAGRRRLPLEVEIRLENEGARSWPGLDPDPEGLVRLRYAFVAEDGTAVVSESSALAADVPPGGLELSVPVVPPARAGRYRLRAELVQRVEGEERPLRVAPVEREVEVRPAL